MQSKYFVQSWRRDIAALVAGGALKRTPTGLGALKRTPTDSGGAEADPYTSTDVYGWRFCIVIVVRSWCIL